MRICLVGTFSRDLRDEGHANICAGLAAQLEKRHKVFQFDAFQASRVALWRSVHSFGPDVVHFVPGATLRSFVLLRLLKLYTGAKTVISLVNPRIHSISWRLISLVRPDLILNQSYQIEKISRDLGIQTEYLPNGVDTSKFTPVEPHDKLALREKYGVNASKFVILHVGHLTKDRGVLILSELVGPNKEILIISSSYFKADQSIRKSLIRSGCLVWREYFENIQQLYQLADCYVFPTAQNKAILMPLSILEAMSCNLPVTCTPLDGIVRVFGHNQVNGLVHLNNSLPIEQAIEKARGCINPETRNAVLDLSWNSVGNSLDSIYQDLLCPSPRKGVRNERTEW